MQPLFAAALQSVRPYQNEHQTPYSSCASGFGSYRSLNFLLTLNLAVWKMYDHSDYFVRLISDECDTSRVARDEEGVGTLRKQFGGLVLWSPLRE
jgi:hypothetical protein